MRSNLKRWAHGATVVVVIITTLLMGSVHAAPVASLGPNSHLPYPTDADVWVDGTGTFNRSVGALPGGVTGTLGSSSFLVFRPKGDNLKIEEFAGIYAAGGYIADGSAPLFKASSVPTAEMTTVLNAKETFVYKTRVGGKWLVLGLIRNLRSQHQLASAVILNGSLDTLQAVAEANRLVELYAGEAQRRRQAPPMPTGTVPAGPTARWEGPKLAQLLQAINRDPAVTPRVKEMAASVIPQAVSINYSTWKTPSPLSDQAFVEFYTQQGPKLGWGAPPSTDQTQPGRPTLLFQRANGEGYIMLRAQPSQPGPIGTVSRPSTTIIVLDMEAKKPTK